MSCLSRFFVISTKFLSNYPRSTSLNINQILVSKLNKILLKKTGLSFNYIVTQGKWTTFQQLVQLLFGLASTMIFARFLTQEVYGQYQFILTTLGILSITSIPAFETSLSRSIAIENNSNYLAVTKKRFYASLLGSLIFILIGIYYYQNQFSLGSIFLLISFFFPLLYAPNNWKTIYIGTSRFDILAKRSIKQDIVLYFFLYLSVFIFPNNLFYFIFIYLFLKSTFNLWWFYKSPIPPINILKSPEDKEVFSYGWFLTKVNILSDTTYHIDKLIIGFLNFELLAIFVLAYKPIEIVNFFIKSLYKIFFPKFAQAKTQIIPLRYVLIIFLSGIVVAIILTLISEPLISFLYSNKNTNIINIFRKLLWIIPFYFVNLLLEFKALAKFEKIKLLRIKFHEPVLTLILSFSILYLSNSLEFFFMSKIYSSQIIRIFIFSFIKN